MHHVKDAHEWHLWGPEHGGTSIYLPVIIYDNGLKMFSSSNFYHGEEGSSIDHKKPINLLVFTKELDLLRGMLFTMKKFTN